MGGMVVVGRGGGGKGSRGIGGMAGDGVVAGMVGGVGTIDSSGVVEDGTESVMRGTSRDRR